MHSSKIYIFSNGRVAAIDKKSGGIAWEVKLKDVTKIAKWSSYSVGQLSEDETKLYIGVSGVIICLDKKDGRLLWENPLKGWGYGFISIAGTDSSAASAAQHQKQAAASATS